MGRRKLFISYQHDDQKQAEGFRLLRYNKNVDFDFIDKQLFERIDSSNPDYIRRCIREEMRDASVVAVLIGENTHASPWIQYEIEIAVEQGKGLVGIRLKDCEHAIVPPALEDAGARVVDWDPHKFQDAVNRAAVSVKRITEHAEGPGGPGLACAK